VEIKETEKQGRERWRREATPWEADMIAIIGLAWLLAIWIVVLAFSVYFSQNMN
jgi:polyferredoxin